MPTDAYSPQLSEDPSPAASQSSRVDTATMEDTHPIVAKWNELQVKSHKLWDRIALWNTTETLLDTWRPSAERAADLTGSKQPEPDSDMGDVFLGDVTITQTAPTVSAPRHPQSSGLGKLASIALIAGSLATGGAAVIAAPIILDWLKPKPTPVQPAPPTYDPTEPILLPGKPE